MDLPTSRATKPLRTGPVPESLPVVLLVDDDPAIRETLRLFLERILKGVRVKTAHSAVSAFDLLRAGPVDVLVTDQRMPGIPGIEFLARVRHEFPDVSTVMISGHADEQLERDATERGGVSAFLSKPIDSGEFVAAVRRVLDARVKP
jgi:DNA-binding NarL/FixJ family response regulator